MPRTRFGVHLPTSGTMATARNIIELAMKAETLGFDPVWAQDHLSFGIDWLRAGIVTSGRFDQINSETVPNMFESLTTLSVIAGKTSTIRIGTGVLVPALRDPVLVAKQSAALQELSDGRLVIGIGSGDYEREFDVLGADFKERGKLTDEFIAVLRSIWSEERVTNFEGKYFSLRGGEFFPKPRHIPILVAGGGLSLAPITRAVRFGDGWIPTPYIRKKQFKLTPLAYSEGVKKIKSLAALSGRDISRFEYGLFCILSLAVSDEIAQKVASSSLRAVGLSQEDGASFNLIGSSRTVREKIEEYVGAGTQTFDMRIVSGSLEESLEMLEQFSSDIIPSF